MDYIYPLVEIGATYIENTIILLSVTTASEPRRKGWSHILSVLLLSLVSSVLVNIMNNLSIFSFLTPLLTMGFVVLLASQITAKSSFIIRATSCILTYLVIQTVDYILFVFMGICFGVFENTFVTLTTLGPMRSIFLCTDKLCDVIIFLFVRNALSHFNSLSKKLCTRLFIFSAVAYGIMQFLFSTIISPDLVAMQIAVISSWFFVLCFIVAILVLFSALTKSEHDRLTREMLQAENALMAKNYQTLHTDRVENAKRQHDFIHHLKTIRGLAQNQNYEELSKYVDSLLNIPYREATICHSGNDIIDAIINCKAAEAEQDGIIFDFLADFHLPTTLDPVDICGILSNQIDNALEACRTMQVDSVREVYVDIKQKENFAFFTVKNTVEENPLLNNPNLLTTKTDKKTLHGLGISNIRDTAEKNNGSLLYEFDDGSLYPLFLSVFNCSIHKLIQFRQDLFQNAPSVL